MFNGEGHFATFPTQNALIAAVLTARNQKKTTQKKVTKMKYKYEFPVHPITEQPTNTFRYIGYGGLSTPFFPEDYNSYESKNAVGWIYDEPEKTPILEDGKWYLVEKLGTGKRYVRLFRNGCWYDGDNLYSFGFYTVIAEMQEVKE